MPHNMNKMIEYLGLAYKDSDYTATITNLNVNVGAETHLGGRHMSAVASLLAAIARVLSSTSIGSTALRKGTRKPHCRNRCRLHAKTCRAYPLATIADLFKLARLYVLRMVLT